MSVSRWERRRRLGVKDVNRPPLSQRHGGAKCILLATTRLAMYYFVVTLVSARGARRADAAVDEHDAFLYKGGKSSIHYFAGGRPIVQSAKTLENHMQGTGTPTS